MHPYRTHLCHELRPSQEGQTVRLSGWIHKKRDHGDLIFIDLRDTMGQRSVLAKFPLLFLKSLKKPAKRALSR